MFLQVCIYIMYIPAGMYNTSGIINEYKIKCAYFAN